MKWSCVEHVAHQSDSRWTKRIIHWRPRLHKISIDRPQKPWLDDVKIRLGGSWHQIIQIKQAMKKAGEAYVQKSTMKGCLKKKKSFEEYSPSRFKLQYRFQGNKRNSKRCILGLGLLRYVQLHLCIFLYIK